MTEYTLRVPTAMYGDAIGLVEVSEAMARHAATGYGTLPLHGPTLKSLRLIHTKSLLRAARAGRLLVCNQAGYQGTVDEIIDAAKNSGDLSEVHRYLEEPGGVTEVDWDMTCFLPLYVRKQHLIEWGNANGDVFHIVDMPVDVTEFGPKDEHGEFAYRGMMPRTESSDEEQSAPAAKGEAKTASTTKKKLAQTWWRKDYEIMTMAQSAGDSLRRKNKRTSNRAIGDAVALEIEQREKCGKKRKGPDGLTIKNADLLGWKYEAE